MLLTTARRRLREDARQRRRSIVEHLSRASDPSAMTVYLEDAAALVGIALAMAALVLHLLTGSAAWDGGASICVGLLLIAVAALLARRSKALLTDESVPEDLLRQLRHVVQRPEWVAEIRKLEAIFVGPSRLLVIAIVAPVPKLGEGRAYDLIRCADRLRQDLLKAPIAAEVHPVTAGRFGQVCRGSAREAARRAAQTPTS